MLSTGPIFLLVLIVGGIGEAGPPPPASPEARAVAFLSVEVPRWSRDNHCYSCHNNGDAARALYKAAGAGYPVTPEALADTTRWLIQPTGWDHNGGESPFSDKRLARVVFTTTLETAVTTGWVRDRSVLLHAAERLVLDQAADGAWPLGGEDATGSPATYGRALATLAARRSLFSADPGRFRTAIDRADTWLARQAMQTVTDASVCLLACAENASPARNGRLKRGLEVLRQGQSDDGGWGPHVGSPPEPFDTALAILALVQCDQSPEVRGMTVRGRAFLVAQQQPDGGWIETTRPPGNVSYAQRISTAGWATLALVATREFSVRGAGDLKR
jgi:hypothetical protein